MLEQAFEALPPNGLDGAMLFVITAQGKPTLLMLTQADRALPPSDETAFLHLLRIEFMWHVPTEYELTTWLRTHPKILEGAGKEIVLLAVKTHLASEHGDSSAPPPLSAYVASDGTWYEYDSTQLSASCLLALLEKSFPRHRILLPLAQFVRMPSRTADATEAYKGHK